MKNQNGKKILIVDDDENLRTVLSDKFKAQGFEVFGAGDGEEGLKQALELHPDIILLDIMMPKMDGWTALGKLREDNWGKHAKVVVLTVLEDVSDVAKAMEKDSFDYIVKTDRSLDEVAAQVQEMVNSK